MILLDARRRTINSVDHEETIFEHALGIRSPRAREGYLRDACAGDHPMLERLQGLLRAHDRAGRFLEHRPPAASVPSLGPKAVPSAARARMSVPLTEKPGDRIGRYKLLQQIGEGGCGVVYMAEQVEPVRRRVALKIIKLGMDTRQVVARFEAERQALALMDHPNIAKVHDGGATKAGRPYFVMELVRGTKITGYCDERMLATPQRLELFIQICHAVQHAHQKGIIHRDLKPSNILVTVNDGVAVPKIIDFGIAKATNDQRLTDQTVFTAFEQFIGTPAYMSPEQAQVTSVDIDTRSDIYSLGVLLYELLTGRTPFDTGALLKSGLDEMRRTIREQEPARPSTRVSTLGAEELTSTAKRHGLEPPKLISQLRGDLDWIVMKCLEKDRARRYETANGLAMDIQRYLSNEPVVARPPSRLYEFQKSVRRHKVGFAATGAVMLALLLGLGVATREVLQERTQRQRAVTAEIAAETEAAKSRQVAQLLKEMLASVSPSIALGRDTTLLGEILNGTARRIGTELTNQPEVEIELRVTLAWAYSELSLSEQMLDMASKAVQLCRRLSRQDTPMVAGALLVCGEALRRQARLEEAEILEREALALERKLHGNDSHRVAQVLQWLTYLLSDRGKLEAQENVVLERLAIAKRAGRGESSEMAEALDNLADLRTRQGRLEEGETLYRESLALNRKLRGAEHPEVKDSLFSLARNLQAQGKLDEAESLLRESLAIERKVQDRRVDPFWELVPMLKRRGALAELDALDREQLSDMRNRLPADDPELARGLAVLASDLLAEHKFTEAEPLARECLAIRQKRLPDNWLAFDARSLLGACLLCQKKYADAEPLLISGYEGMRQREDKIGAAGLARVGEALQRLLQLGKETGRSDQAAKWKAEVAAWHGTVVVRCHAPAHEPEAQCLNNLAWLLATCGDPDLRDGQSAVRIAENAVAKSGRKVPIFLDTLAAAYAELGEFASAVKVQREAIALVQGDKTKRDFESRLKLYESNLSYHEPDQTLAKAP